ncbi:helix-turn-helix domain-containing protein [Thiorhodococcus minor]|uniref:helix-turn-helix domain-containing protein n=1 Tax=Thiorhodococcus minor TaxID=57489 RepID=UPI001FD8085D|nr:helix-turn-helix domain-containing protein [Thiorhodococcus minor]
MHDCRLSDERLTELRSAHREVREIREAYRINAVILLGQGRGVKDVADALLMDPETVRTYFKRYQKGGVDELLRMSYVGSETLLLIVAKVLASQPRAFVMYLVSGIWKKRLINAVCF